jgi:hypothetical protein
MKRVFGFVVLLMFSISIATVAAALDSYQVTGPVLEVKDNSITVQKGSEKWEIARDKETKVTGDLKVGSKVTIKYQMKATSIEAKEEAKKTEKKESKKK